MKVQITDLGSFQAIRPNDAASYMRSEEWVLEGYWKGRKASVWLKNGTSLAIPQDPALADYSTRLSEAVAQLALAENRSQLDVYRDILVASSDVVRIGLAAVQTSDGSLGLDQGVRLFTAAKEMIFSAARAAIAKKAAYRSRLPQAADEFLKRVKLGQTERGSYVVTLISPVTPELQTPLISEMVETTFDRRVTETLAKSLVSAWSAAEQAMTEGSSRPFSEAVQHGVSSNLCDALASIGELLPVSSTDIRFSWARNRPKPTELPKQLIIPSHAASTLRAAAVFLKEVLSDDNFELSGNVIRLESERVLFGGEVILLGELEPSVFAKFKLALTPEQYQLAYGAHGNGYTVSCRGKLKKEGRYWTVTDIMDFSVSSEE